MERPDYGPPGALTHLPISLTQVADKEYHINQALWARIGPPPAEEEQARVATHHLRQQLDSAGDSPSDAHLESHVAAVGRHLHTLALHHGTGTASRERQLRGGSCRNMDTSRCVPPLEEVMASHDSG